MTEAGRVFSEIEISAMVRSTENCWWQAFIRLGAASGLTVSEMLWLSIHDLDLSSECVRVRATAVSVENQSLSRPPLPLHRERNVPVDSEILRRLVNFWHEAKPGELIFVPHWRLEELSVSNQFLPSPAVLIPNLASSFAWIQREARLMLARDTGASLEAVKWPRRGLDALRRTYAVGAVARYPRSLALEYLGLRSDAGLKRLGVVSA